MMSKDGGRRIATSRGALLIAAERAGDAPAAAPESLFEPQFWAARGELFEVTGGRGAAWFIESRERSWVLRHYRRGGFIAKLSPDGYVWNGERAVRAFAEWRLLDALDARGLPVPQPIAARYQRSGMTYRCDLITRRIADARPLSALLSLAPLEESVWRAVGAAVARLHAAGADHADLNAHNVLVDGGGQASVVDFDRGRLRMPGGWTARNLSRLRRSLVKVSRHLPPDRYPAAAWGWLLAGYLS